MEPPQNEWRVCPWVGGRERCGRERSSSLTNKPEQSSARVSYGNGQVCDALRAVGRHALWGSAPGRTSHCYDLRHVSDSLYPA